MTRIISLLINNTKNDRNCQDMNNNVKKLVLISLYTAIFVVLSIYGTVTFSGMKLTLQNLPIYIGAITLGSAPGAIIGFLGMLINQLVTYGFSATTLFWVLPQTIIGGVCGYLFENKIVKVGGGLKFWITIIGLQVILTMLNTVVIAVDALIYGYYNFIVVFGPFILRIMVSILVGIIYSIVIPVIIKMTKKIH